ncbi:MAG TPA: DUF885 domain-containing protein, partial [Acidobacteriota bacterium]|nr:DUF885 domain-containing protein [Acidobacteriota bacterium]
LMNVFDQFVSRFLNEYNRFHPVNATLLGHHDFNTQLDDLSTRAIEIQRAWLESARQELAAIPIESLDTHRQVDHTIVSNKIFARQLDLDVLRVWRRDPCFYNDLATRSIHGLITRPYAPLDERAHAFIARLRQIPALLNLGRQHLEAELSDPPALPLHASGLQPLVGIPHSFVEAALTEFDGGLWFFEHDVTRVLDNVSDSQLRRQGYDANDQVVDLYRDLLTWLETSVRPRSSGSFALGRDVFAAKLRAEEHITTSVEEIVAVATEKLRQTQARMHELVARIGSCETVWECVKHLSERDQPTVHDVLPAYAHELGAARQFILDQKLVDVPPGELRMEEMPPFLRDITIAAIERTGPFEKAELPSFFFVTLPDPKACSNEQAEMLRAHSRLMRQTTIVHEAYPGHFIQGLHWALTPSAVRKSFSSMTFVEGWAHYCEQMMAEQGFWDDDPQLFLFQEFDSLLRIGRVIVATRMHTEGMTVAEAEAFLQKEVWQEPVLARMEAHRYMRDPFVLVYSWGKWQFQSLLEEFRRQQGSNFSLGDFHNQVLAHGEPPVELLRRLILET